MSRKYKIAVFHNLPSGGAKRALYELSRVLHEGGHILDLYVPETANESFLPLDPFVRKKRVFSMREWGIDAGGQMSSRAIGHGVGRLSLGFIVPWIARAMNIGRSKRCQEKIAAEINKGDYDCVFVHPCRFTQSPYILRYLRLPSLYYCQEPLRQAYEVLFDGTLESPGGPLCGLLSACARRVAQKIDAKNIRCATAVLVNSYFSMESLLKAYGIRPTVCHLGVNTGVFTPLSVMRRDMVLSVGRFYKHKGFRFVIESLGKITQASRPELVLVGESGASEEKRYLMELAREKKVGIQIRENVGEDELVFLYNQACVVAYAPDLEPFGLVPLEAMACGTPVVAVKEGGVRETVRDGEDGFLVERDPRAFARAIEQILAQKDVWNNVMKRNRETLGTRWSWERATDKVIESLEKVLEWRPEGDERL